MKPGTAQTYEYKGCTLVQLEEHQFIVNPEGSVVLIESDPSGQFAIRGFSGIHVKDANPGALLQRYGDKLETWQCLPGMNRAIDLLHHALEGSTSGTRPGLERALKELERLTEKMS